MKHFLFIIIFAVFWFVSAGSFAQSKINTIKIDELTYYYFVKSNWKELVKVGKVAKKNKIDFYYLDIRLGIAYYNLKKYRTAVTWLEKAYKMDETNDLVKSYLYYAYLLSGRRMDAEKIKITFNDALNNKLGLNDSPVIDALSFDTRFETNENYKVIPDTNQILTQSVRNKYVYFSLGMDNLFGQNKLYFNFGRINKTNNIYFVDSTQGQGGMIYSQANSGLKIIQNQFYVNYSNQVSYGLSLSIAVNWLHLVNTYDSSYYQTNYNYIVSFLALRKDFSNFKAGVFASVSNLEKKIQIQPGADFVWYPLSNTNLYLSATGSFQIQKTDGNWINEFVFCPAVGIKLFEFYVEPSYTFGKINNFTEADALIVDNDNDFIKNRFDMLIYTYPFKGKLNLFFKYQHYKKENDYFLNKEMSSLTYKNNSYTFGIKWSF